jgi:hypothetical protein
VKSQCEEVRDDGDIINPSFDETRCGTRQIRLTELEKGGFHPESALPGQFCRNPADRFVGGFDP